MAPALAAVDEHDTALEQGAADEKRLREVHERALQRFDVSVMPQMEMRSLALAARRFVTIPGAQWEGDFGDPFPDNIKLEINLTREGLEKIYRDYTDNRIVPDFRPAGGKGDEDSAQTLDGMHRADSYFFKAQQARDNAFFEGSSGGFGAYRLTNEWADPYDKDSDEQRINPGLAIVDADQRVFFGPSDLYDKSDAPYAFVITAHDRQTFLDENKDAQIPDDWPDAARPGGLYDWFRPDVIKTAEYYEVEDSDDTLFILTHRLSKQEERYWKSELDDGELADLRKMGWQVKSRNMRRKRVHKYVLTGSEVLEDQGVIAGDRIPIAPYYGKRSFVDGVERFEGYVQGKMDVQRAYNMVVSKLAETSAFSPREIPIFAPEQMPPNLAAQWGMQVAERHSYALVKPLINEQSGEVIAMGPIGKVEAPQVDQATAALVQIVRNDLTFDQQDGSQEAKANTSEDALAFAATRIDAKSGIYLDNWAQTVHCEGEIYLSKASDTYFEPGRTVETMTEDGNDGTATLVEQYTDPRGVTGYRNDFTRGHYKVIVTVTEATTTRREKAVRSALGIASAAGAAGNNDLAQVALLFAVMNHEGEGTADFQNYARKELVAKGVVEPNDEEKAQMEQAQQEEGPDPQQQLLAAQIDEKSASAAQLKTKALLNAAQAQAIGGPEKPPAVPDGLEAFHKVAQIGKTVADTRKTELDTAHMPQKLAIEATNADTNRIKAEHQGMMARLKSLFTRN